SSMLFLCYRYVILRYIPSFPTRRSSDLKRFLNPFINKSCPPMTMDKRKAPITTGCSFPNIGILDKATIKMSKAIPVFKFSLLSRSEEHTSELQSRFDLVCRLLLEKKKLN